MIAAHTLVVLFFLGSVAAVGQTTPARTVPARRIPTPATISSEMQRRSAAVWSGNTDAVTKTSEQWKSWIKEMDVYKLNEAASLQKTFHVSIEGKRIGGVPVYVIKPEHILPQNQKRLLVHVHGGGYIFFGGMAATTEAILMAHYTGTEVISIDYRMPPDYPFPAAVDDSVAVWQEVIQSYPPNKVGLFGSSAGGGLTLAVVIRLKELGLPSPGALMAGTPWADLTKTGDTYFTNEFVDNVLGSEDGWMDAAAQLYAGTHDRKEPLISPVYGDLSGFPPTILLSGTRDLLLSDTVRVHQKMLQAGVDARLLVFEAQSHGQYLEEDTPECAIALGEVARFFAANL